MPKFETLEKILSSTTIEPKQSSRGSIDFNLIDAKEARIEKLFLVN